MVTGTETKSISPSLLYEFFFVYVILAATGAFQFQLTGVEPTMVTPTNPVSDLARLNSVFIYSATIIIYLSNRRRIYLAIRSSWPIFLFPALALLSCFWAPDITTTLRRAIALFFNFLALATLVAILPSIKAVRVVIIALGISILCSLLWAFFLPRYGLHTVSDWVEPVHAGLWRGVFTHKNTLGNVSSVALVTYLFFGNSVIRSFVFRVAVILSSVACLIGSRSGTGLVLAGLMILVVLFMRVLTRMNQFTRLLVGGAGLILLLFLTVMAIPTTYVVLEALGKSPDMTGRIPLWTALITWGNEHALIGFGYSTGFEFVMMPRLFEYTSLQFVNAHNGYLETFISFGYVGLCILAFVLASFVASVLRGLAVIREDDRIILPFVTAMFFNAIFGNVTESLFLAQNTFFNMSWALSYIMIASRNWTEPKPRRKTWT